MALKKTPLTLSIIIPAYNEERHLEDCLISIKKQTVAPDEVIVVDNNSTDKTPQIAESFSFVKLIQEKQQGIVYARNTGFNAAESDIIGRLDADTVLPENWVSHILDFYSNNQPQSHAWTGGGIFRNTRFPRFYGWLTNQIAYRFNRLLLGHYILWGSNMAITKHQWSRVAGRVCLDNDIHEDLDLAIHLNELDVQITYQSFIKVNVVMKRLYKPKDLKANLMLWPETLKKHDKKTWIFGWLGAQYLYSLRRLVWAVSSDRSG